MINCPSCNTECPDNANFCLNCGISLKPDAQRKLTPDTGNGYQDTNDQLNQMLKRLMPTSYAEKLFACKGRMQGERRVVTILFSDVKGSTSMAENLDPEEVLEVMNGAFGVLIKPIMNYEGTIARLMGDAILAFFGAPVAHEDDPYRACRAALDILEGAKDFSRKLEEEKGIKGFGVRVGINTGLVVVGEVGTDFRGEYTAMGDEVNVAARMESAAETGTILITEATRSLIKNDFELLSLGPIKVKGKSEPVNTYRIIDIKRTGSGDQYNSRFKSPLIGRKKELKELHSSLSELSNGTGGIVSIIGDNGLGKSRLVSEIRKNEFPGIKWVEGKALAYTINNSYWMFRSLLKNFFGFHQESMDTAILDRLHQRIESFFDDKTSDIYPYIEHFLLPSGGLKEVKDRVLSDSRSIQGQFHYAFKEFIKKESDQNPIAFVLEDIQWCDSPSLDLIYELLELSTTYKLLFFLIYRFNENDKRIWNFHNRILQDFGNKHKVIAVHPLEKTECDQLFANILGNRSLPLEVQRRVIEKTEGNPAFLEEVVHSIIELGFNQKVGTLSEFVTSESIFRVPNLLHNSIMARVDNLDQSDKMLLQTASVIGRIFQMNLLTQVVKDKLSKVEIEKSLTELQLREFILRHLPANLNTGKINFQKEFTFKQEVVQNVVYNSLLLTNRQDLHRQIAEEIEKIYSGNTEEFADALSLHFEKAKVYDKAIIYSRIAADRAKNFFANDDAIFFYLKTLKLSEKSRLNPKELVEVYESLGDIYSLKADYSKTIKYFHMSLNHTENSDQAANIYYKCGQVFERWGRYEDSIENYNKGLSLITGEKNKVLSAYINAGKGMVFYRQGNLTDAVRLNSEALDILKKYGDEMASADIYNNMGIIYSKLGDLEKSLEFHNKCLRIREGAGNSDRLAATNNNLGFLYQLKNEPEKAVEYYSRSLEFWEKIGNLHGIARTYDNLSQIYIAQGNEELGMDYNLKAISILGRIARDGSQINSDLWLQTGVW